MNLKSILRVTVMSSAVILTILLMPAVHSSIANAGALGDNLVDPIKTEGGWISGTTIDSIHVTGSTYYPVDSPYYAVYEAMLGEIGNKVRIYRGIPYAAPPVGNLRWKPPQPVIPWENIRECTKFAPMAPQSYPATPVYDSIPLEGMSEDVLYLNIQTPAKHAHERLPVMVLFHGGGLTIGSVNRVSDNCPPLPQHGVVSVTVQHRIGVFGYMAHPELTAESGYGGSGNYGQMDLIAALKWVKRNIANFGGDPNNVTIWGHSGGGAKTNFLLASPKAKGLFHRAICEAGFSTAAASLATAEGYGSSLQAKLGAANLADMRLRPWKEILDATLNPPLIYSSGFSIDNYYMPDTIGNIFAAGAHSDVPYMVGMGGAEVRATTPTMAALLQTMSAKQKSPIYTYLFTHVPENWGKNGVYAYHGLEVSYQYGVVDTVMRMYGVLFTPGPSVPVDPGINQNDYWLQDAVMTMWVNFATTGNPTPKYRGWSPHRLITWTWPEYDASDKYLDIGVPPLIKTGYSLLTAPVPPRY